MYMLWLLSSAVPFLLICMSSVHHSVLWLSQRGRCTCRYKRSRLWSDSSRAAPSEEREELLRSEDDDDDLSDIIDHNLNTSVN